MNEKQPTEIYDINGHKLGLIEIAKFFIYIYPKDIFITEPKEIVAIRDNFIQILKNLNQYEE